MKFKPLQRTVQPSENSFVTENPDRINNAKTKNGYNGISFTDDDYMDRQRGFCKLKNPIDYGIQYEEDKSILRKWC